MKYFMKCFLSQIRLIRKTNLELRILNIFKLLLSKEKVKHLFGLRSTFYLVIDWTMIIYQLQFVYIRLD